MVTTGTAHRGKQTCSSLGALLPFLRGTKYTGIPAFPLTPWHLSPPIS